MIPRRNTNLAVELEKCEPEIKKMRNTSQPIFGVLCASSIMAVVGVGVTTGNFEYTTLTSSMAIACLITVFLGWASFETNRSFCLRLDIGCEGSENLASGIASGINSMASVLTIAAVLYMYRAQTGAWMMIGAYLLIGAVGSIVASVAAELVQKHLVDRCLDDAIPLDKNPIGIANPDSIEFENSRTREFAPVKNLRRSELTEIFDKSIEMPLEGPGR